MIGAEFSTRTCDYAVRADDKIMAKTSLGPAVVGPAPDHGPADVGRIHAGELAGDGFGLGVFAKVAAKNSLERNVTELGDQDGLVRVSCMELSQLFTPVRRGLRKGVVVLAAVAAAIQTGIRVDADDVVGIELGRVEGGCSRSPRFPVAGDGPIGFEARIELSRLAFSPAIAGMRGQPRGVEGTGQFQ